MVKTLSISTTETVISEPSISKKSVDIKEDEEKKEEESNTSSVTELSNLINHTVIFHVLSSRKGRKKEEPVEVRPCFENCLRLLCRDLLKCYHAKTHNPIKYISGCVKFKTPSLHHDFTITKVNVSDRELCQMIVAMNLREEDIRDKELLRKLKSLLGKNSYLIKG
jgi:hypothetical protein